MKGILNIGGILAKVCGQCGVAKELEKFHVRNASPDGLQRHCAECGSKRKRK